MDKTVSLLLFTFIHFYQTSFVTSEENAQRVRKFRRDESLSSLIEMSTVLVRDKMACFAVCLAQTDCDGVRYRDGPVGCNSCSLLNVTNINGVYEAAQPGFNYAMMISPSDAIGNVLCRYW